MKKTIKGLEAIRGIAIIALVAVIGFSMAGCGGGDDGSGPGGGNGTGTAPTITTTTLSGGTVGTAYSQTLSATGDTPITWSIETGSSLPNGLSINATTGVIAGTPTTADTFNFTVKATNAKGSVTKDLSIVIGTPIFNDADGAANIGRVGPGEGIVFYYSPAGFTVEGYGNPGDTGYFATYTAHYLEVAPTITGSSIEWGDYGTEISGVTTSTYPIADALIGNGRKDTALIVAHLGTSETNRAAQICASLTTGGKTDWFLPSFGELMKLFPQRALAGIDIYDYWYWSSTQYGGVSSTAWCYGFDYEHWDSFSKDAELKVRAIRAF